MHAKSRKEKEDEEVLVIKKKDKDNDSNTGTKSYISKPLQLVLAALEKEKRMACLGMKLQWY
eukprot:13225691-Ditylum_brightwellii.AAC.1